MSEAYREGRLGLFGRLKAHGFSCRAGKAVGLVLAALREIFDEAAYARFLSREQIAGSRAAYSAFLKEHDVAKARRPRCC